MHCNSHSPLCFTKPAFEAFLCILTIYYTINIVDFWQVGIPPFAQLAEIEVSNDNGIAELYSHYAENRADINCNDTLAFLTVSTGMSFPMITLLHLQGQGQLAYFIH